MIGWRVATAIVVVALAGCQTLPRETPPVPGALPPPDAFDLRTERLAGLAGWTLRGRGALAAGGRGWNGSVHWVQCADSFDLRFIAPLGAGTLRISGLPGAMRVRGTDGTDFHADDLEAELEHLLGARLPVESLRWWVVGLPAPDAPYAALELDAAGRATEFLQSEWTVSYPRYTTHASIEIPALVVADRDGTRVRVVVDSWTPVACL